ncbi:MAG: hypothetical protein WCK33_08395, partial [Phycisphaerae bacterium]
MAVGREYSVLEIDGPRLAAVSATVTGDRIAIRRWLISHRPESLAGDQAGAVGTWVGGEFSRGQLSRARTILAVSRGDVVLKQLALPASSTLAPHELAGVVRLQMVRQLAMQVEGAAIDYLPPVPHPGEPQAPSIHVMAGAMPADRVEWSRRMAEGAGLTLRRIGLRCFGASALLSDLSQRRHGPVLGVAIGAGSVEFVVVEDGQLAFARAVDAVRPADGEQVAFADRLAVEAKRTWMSFRAVRAGGEPELVAVVGEPDLGKVVGERAATALSCAWDLVGMPAFVEVPSTMTQAERALLAPLVGLLCETLLSKPSLDFANPRKVPDPGAKRRQGVLIAALSLIVVGGAGTIVADRLLGGLRAQEADLHVKEAALRKEFEAFQVEHARVTHAQQWVDAKADWIGHLRGITRTLPDPTAGVLDGMSGRLASTTAFTMASGGYLNGRWTQPSQISFDLSGKVDARQTASDLRERLLEIDTYGVESQGPDAPDRFDFAITTSRLAPADGVNPPPVAPAAKSKAANKSSG